MSRIAPLAFVTLTGVAASALVAEARPVYARNEGKECGYCHIRPQGGGDRGFRGQFYGANGLSFDHFKEEREALIAGLAPNAQGRNAAPSTSYVGNVGGPATQQIQLASLRGPVAILFVGRADDPSKLAVKTLASLAKTFGKSATFLAVTRSAESVKLTDDLGGLIRVLPDPDGAAAKKFGATCELDIAVAAKLGDPLKTWAGLSKSGLDEIVKALGGDADNLTPEQWKTLPEKPLRGAKLAAPGTAR